MMPIVFQSLANFRFICQLTGKFNINSNECAFLPVTINIVEKEGELRTQDHRLVLCQVAHVQGKTLEFQMAAAVVTKQFAVQILICFVFSSVQFIVVCCFWRTHISQTSCWYKSARPCTSVGARSGLTYFTRKISQYTTEKFAHDYVHLAKNFGGGGGCGKVATLRTFATFG